jgi:hypothetical protein
MPVNAYWQSGRASVRHSPVTLKDSGSEHPALHCGMQLSLTPHTSPILTDLLQVLLSCVRAISKRAMYKYEMPPNNEFQVIQSC